ncbi:MAG: hypothetical protein E7644_05225 [Ruminococcaceae bacterium]|nr:hypothetical protein [Oscillospiraceae bacterium]
MKTTKLLSLLLCLSLLIGVLLLVSCGPKAVVIDLADYRLVYDDAFAGHAAFTSEISAFSAAIKTETGLNLRFQADSAASVAEKEVLIGETSREETATLLSKVKGDGYAIGVVNGKLVIAGTTPALTLMALRDFSETYFDGFKDGTAFSIIKETNSDVAMITLGSAFGIVYSERNDDDADTDPGTVTEDNPDGYDYPVVAAKKLRTTLKNLIKIKSTSFNVSSDAKANDGKEILVGTVNREAAIAFAKVLDANECGIRMDGNKLVVMGHNDTMLRSALVLFDGLMAASVEGEGDAAVIRIPADFVWTQTKSTSWELDFPRPEGVELRGSVDVGEGSLQLYYAGEGANAATFEKYCATLKEAGYTVVTENIIEENRFCTLVNTKKKLTLHVTYAAYSYAEAENIDLFEPCIRVVSASTTDVGNTIKEELLTPDYSYTKLTDTTLTGVRFDYDSGAWGNDYIIQLEDGSFFVQDGGSVAGKDYVRLYNVLCDLFYRTHGQKPSTSNPIIVSGWYLTHGHADHYGNFLQICKRYASTVRVEYLFANMPSDDECYNVENPNLTIRNEMLKLLSLVDGGMTYIKMHAGQVFHVRNMEIETLYTHEDIYPWNPEIFNDTSTVIRTTIYNTDGKGNVQGKSTSIMWPGDLNYRGSQSMISMYGSYLKSDIVQVSHHGYRGCEYAFYVNVAPSIVLWPNSLKTFLAQTDNPNDKSKPNKIDYQIAYKLASVQYIVVLDQYNTTITITKDGPDMSIGGATGLYNAYEHSTTPITAYGGAIIKK